MRTRLTGRVANVRAVVSEGGAVCRAWPHVRFLEPVMDFARRR